jgi:hypothetical protein
MKKQQKENRNGLEFLNGTHNQKEVQFVEEPQWGLRFDKALLVLLDTRLWNS